MARGVRGGIIFAECGVSLGRNEAKKNVDTELAFVRDKQAKGESVPAYFRHRVSLARPFIAWDGEGWTDKAGDGLHHYMLFGASTGDMTVARSLSTVQCLDLMLKVERENPNAYHVWFAGNYDVNMILRDVDIVNLAKLQKFGACTWRGYSLKWLRGKHFQVTRDKVTCRIDDTFSFYHVSFVKACEEYLGESPELEAVRAGKILRESFQLEDLPQIRAYWQHELKLMVKLTDRLREYLDKAGIQIHRWHGPGAVAGAILKRRGHRHSDMGEEVNRCAQYAYSGGRFEQFRIGRAHRRIWQYDIRSAYPYAISLLPTPNGEWRHVSGECEIRPFSLYHVTYHAQPKYAPGAPHPLFWRAKNGAVFYPDRAEGWYWGSELVGLSNITIIEAWLYEVPDSRHPFAWITEMYNRRALWKRIGEPAQLALKLAMNSIYGKLAQQVGFKVLKDGTIKIPTYHQLEFAGFVTATTRGMIRQAMSQKPWAVVACETDSVAMTEPLDLDVGEELGQWEETVYDDMMYVQSGVYWALHEGEWKTRTRGFGRNVLDWQGVDEWLGTITDAQQAYKAEPLTVVQNRFNTLGRSIGTPRWRTWSADVRSLRAGTPGGKREHYLDDCAQCPGALNKRFHTMRVAVDLPGIDFDQMSSPYPLKWKDAASEMQEYMAEDDEWITEEMI